MSTLQIRATGMILGWGGVLAGSIGHLGSGHLAVLGTFLVGMIMIFVSFIPEAFGSTPNTDA